MHNLSVDAENKIDEIVADFYNRLTKEIEKLLEQQLESMSVELKPGEKASSRCIRIDHVDDELNMATYYFKDEPILNVRITDNKLAIEFDIPNLETRKEDQK